MKNKLRMICTRIILLAIGFSYLYVESNLKEEKVSKETLTDILLETHIKQPDSNFYQENKESSYILSYSLFGNNWERYGSAVEKIAFTASRSSLYKNWSVRLYHDGKMFSISLQSSLKKKYKNLFFYDVGFIPEFGNVSHVNGMTWRFLAAGDHNVDVMCSRDLDSLLLPREEDAVREWLNSNKLFHVMRDHPLHGVYILGGTWCFRNIKRPFLGDTIAKLVIEKSKKRIVGTEAPWGDGQDVLGQYIWPLISDDVMQHDAYLCSQFNGSVPFPSKRKNKHRFIGMIANLPDSEINLPTCPLNCRPKQHQDWLYC